MLRKNIAVFAGLAVLGYASLFVPTIGYGAFKDINSQKINAELGTIEFRVKLLKDISSDPHNHVLFLGVSSNGAENYSIEIIQDQLIARRFFGNCFLTAFGTPYHFRTGDWHDLKLTWNQASTKFYVDQQEIVRLGLLSTDDVPKMYPGIRLGVEKNFKVANFKTVDRSDIFAESADQEFVKNSSCPNLKELITEAPQEEHRGVALNHFPDQKTRDIIKSYIDLLPADFAKSIKRVVYVEDARFSKRGSGGSAEGDSGSIVLKGMYATDPTVFFHEAAHLYDNKLHICIGVPDEKSEWAAISGVSCYFKGSNLVEFAQDFEKTKVKNGILQPQGGQCAFEDLAIWVGAVYDCYLKNQSLADKMNPSSPVYSEKNIRKMDFLLKKGFISQQLYDKVIQPGQSSGKKIPKRPAFHTRAAKP